MLVIGTGGLASDILDVLSHEMNHEDIVLYNDFDSPEDNFYKDYFKILKTKEEAADYFKNTDSRFILSIGDNQLREKLSHEFIELGGTNPSYISKSAYVGFTSKISETGVFIMHHSSVSMNAQVDEGCIVYINSGIGHNSHIKKYNLISSGVIMSNVKIGEYSTVGIGVNFKPGTEIGNNCMVGIGAVVTKSFGDNVILYGSPAIQKI